MFAGKAIKLHKTRLERLARDKHSSLLQKSVNYGQKKFNNIGPRVPTEVSEQPREALLKGKARYV